MANRKEVFAPDVGGEVEIIEVLVSPGDSLNAEDALFTVESDKASMDIPAPFAGVVAELKVKVGDKINEGDLLALFEAAEAAAEPKAEAKAEPKAEPKVDAKPEPKAEAKPEPKQEPKAEAKPAAKAASKTIEVTVPDIGTDGEVDVIDVLVSVGDSIDAEAGLITVETDKATMDVPSSHAGTVESVAVKTGDKVKQGSLVITLKVADASADASSEASSDSSVDSSADSSSDSSAAESAASQPAANETRKQPPVPDHPMDRKARSEESVAYASPAVRRLAREFGVDLHKVNGSGRKQRIMKEDVQEFVKYELSRPKATASTNTSQGGGGLQVIAQPKVDFSKFGEIEQVPLTRIQKISGPNLHRNWVTIPHVTQFDEADITELEAFRKQENELQAKQKNGIKITPLVFIMKAAAKALRAYPVFNSSLAEDGESLIMKKYVHIGIAVDTPNGLVVPVIRDVDQKGIYQLSEELAEISAKARDGKLKATDMQGGCFSISSLGGIGGTAFTPIVNAPEVAILGVSKSDMKPQWNGKEFVPRLMLPLSLSYDHRVIDGAVAARFSVYLSAVLGDIRKLVL
ncbi:dihydrolipoyllysine-residue acetyltransferase [Pseudidiomarina mangrovi]|uniref:dihydrolipoyllysine-residue acetyltransferase n=1 Tax=Pseudidiomarina mangrovi TaxID=2487133 RepID=UPI000FCADA67|nr:dihydrolipoyllysine-residue acetyltransferase [Pseudidiomarina mangrovi]